MFNSFGNELRFLNGTISTASGKKFNLRKNAIVKFTVGIIGLPHFGARIRANYLDALLDSLQKKNKILDAGCGIGLNTFLASRKGLEVIGVDNDRKKILSAQKMLSKTNYKKTSFVYGDITRLKYKNRTFDAVICFEVLEHVKNDKKALSEISRVMKRGGKLFFSTPGTGFISRNSQHEKNHIREGYSIDNFKKMLKESNLVCKRIIKDEHTPLGFGARLLNDEALKKSLAFSTLLFPLLYLLARIDETLPEMITPNNWIMTAIKK